MIKLMRNLLEIKAKTFNEENGKLVRINSQYVEALNHIQHELEFLLADKLRKKHTE